MTPETLYQIGSITKTFVATAVMCLVGIGKLELDAPLRPYLPRLRLADAGATARVIVAVSGLRRGRIWQQVPYVAGTCACLE